MWVLECPPRPSAVSSAPAAGRDHRVFVFEFSGKCPRHRSRGGSLTQERRRCRTPVVRGEARSCRCGESRALQGDCQRDIKVVAGGLPDCSVSSVGWDTEARPAAMRSRISQGKCRSAAPRCLLTDFPGSAGVHGHLGGSEDERATEFIPGVESTGVGCGSGSLGSDGLRRTQHCQLVFHILDAKQLHFTGIL